MDELCNYVRERLPLRARLVGKDRLDDIVRIAVTEWPIVPLMECGRGSAEEELLLDRLRVSVSRTYELVRGSEPRYGFFWAFVLSAAVSAVIQVILRWWIEKRANRCKIAAWQYSVKGDA
jgi:hypothetical protein